VKAPSLRHTDDSSIPDETWPSHVAKYLERKERFARRLKACPNLNESFCAKVMFVSTSLTSELLVTQFDSVSKEAEERVVP